VLPVKNYGKKKIARLLCSGLAVAIEERDSDFGVRYAGPDLWGHPLDVMPGPHSLQFATRFSRTRDLRLQICHSIDLIGVHIGDCPSSEQECAETQI
jgi:hypothetical protein